MTCIETQHHLHSLIDGCAVGAECDRLQAHLAVCPACRRLVADLRTINDALRRLSLAEPVPHTLVSSCQRRLGELLHRAADR